MVSFILMLDAVPSVWGFIFPLLAGIYVNVGHYHPISKYLITTHRPTLIFTQHSNTHIINKLLYLLSNWGSFHSQRYIFGNWDVQTGTGTGFAVGDFGASLLI